MKLIPNFTLGIGIFYFVIEFVRRGFSYLAINASTMIEDMLMGVIMISSALVYKKDKELGTTLLIVSWAYSFGGMFIPFAAHFEAFLRGETFRADHPHDDVGSIILKFVVWFLSGVVLAITLKQRKELQAA